MSKIFFESARKPPGNNGPYCIYLVHKEQVPNLALAQGAVTLRGVDTAVL